MRKCVVCGVSIEREEDDYCAHHERAARNIQEGYASWIKGYGRISPEEYLARISQLSETGEAARELAKYLARNPGRWILSRP